MSNYIDIKNQSGHIVINDFFKNMELKRKMPLSDHYTFGLHTVTYKEGGVTIKNDREETWEDYYWEKPVKSYYNNVRYYFKLKDNEKIFAIYSPTGSGCTTWYPRKKTMHSPNKTEPYIWTLGPTEAEASSTILYTFGPCENKTSTSTHGLQVFNSGGDILFDSNKKDYLVIKHYGNDSGTFDFGNRKIAIAPLGYRQFGGKSDGYDLRTYTVRYQDKKVSYNETIIGQRTGYYRTFIDTDVYYMLLDVTNL